MKAIITAVGHYAPEKRLTNQELEQMVETNDEWIVARTGIKERRILEDGKGSSYMALRAAESVLEQRNISADDLDLILVATVTPDMMFPATAALVQDGLKASNCWGYDISAGCSGFLCGLSTATQFIETGKYKKILIIGVDKMSAIMDYQDRNSCILFGDGAGAVLLEPSESNELGIDDFIMHVDGSGAEYLYMKAGGSLHPASHETVDKRMHYLYQDGKPIFKSAVAGMTDVAKGLLEKHGLTAKDIKLLVPHQANIRIIDAVSSRLGLTSDQVVVNIQNYGNTTAATIPLALSEAYQDNRLQKGDRVMMVAFGTGFIWGGLLLRWAID
jgi:3-oxoacyl-[acyl-carrier-protein] synthase-3